MQNIHNSYLLYFMPLNALWSSFIWTEKKNFNSIYNNNNGNHQFIIDCVLTINVENYALKKRIDILFKHHFICHKIEIIFTNFWIHQKNNMAKSQMRVAKITKKKNKKILFEMRNITFALTITSIRLPFMPTQHKIVRGRHDFTLLCLTGDARCLDFVYDQCNNKRIYQHRDTEFL